MDLGLKGKNALVTGGSHGIGRAIALALASEGCNVIICARNGERIKEVVREIGQRGVMATGLTGDVCSSEDIDRVIEGVITFSETLHILINNVGGGGRWGSERAEETPDRVWQEVYEKNALAAIRFTMRVIPLMKKQNWGRVITIASIYGKEGGGRPWFNMSKAAEISLMKTLAMNQDYQRHNITFNTVAPGPVWIEGKEQDYYRRYGQPEDVAAVVTFLCSEQTKWVNGACIVVDGGESKSF